jgi:hypothetical protein
MPKIPPETPYLASFRKCAVCGDWMVEVVGLELETHQPVIERVSTKAGNGSLWCRDRCAKRALLRSRDRSRDGPDMRKAPIPRSKCNQTGWSLSPEDWVVVCAVRYEPVSTAIPC